MDDALSQFDILTQWAFAGLAIGVTILFHLLITTWQIQGNGSSDTETLARWQKRFEDPGWWMHAALPIYMIHEFEEHGIDFFGNRYSFQKALCEGLGTPNLNRCPATEVAIFFVNVGTVWIGGVLARRDTLGAGLNFYGTMTINAVVHVVPFLTKGCKYNPGVLTALVFFLPSAYMAFKMMLRSSRCEDSDVARALLVGIVVHVVIIASFLGARGYLREEFVCIVQLLNVLPLFIK